MGILNAQLVLLAHSKPNSHRSIPAREEIPPFGHIEVEQIALDALPALEPKFHLIARKLFAQHSRHHAARDARFLRRAVVDVFQNRVRALKTFGKEPPTLLRDCVRVITTPRVPRVIQVEIGVENHFFRVVAVLSFEGGIHPF